MNANKSVWSLKPSLPGTDSAMALYLPHHLRVQIKTQKAERPCGRGPCICVPLAKGPDCSWRPEGSWLSIFSDSWSCKRKYPFCTLHGKRKPCYSSLGSSPVSYSFVNQHLEWHPEVNWEPVWPLEHRCNLCSLANTSQWAHAFALAEYLILGCSAVYHNDTAIQLVEPQKHCWLFTSESTHSRST